MWIGKDMTRSFHDQFEVMCGLDQMMEEDVMTKYELICGKEQIVMDAVLTKFEVLCGLERMWRKRSRQI
jgi:hypothetical protein